MTRSKQLRANKLSVALFAAMVSVPGVVLAQNTQSQEQESGAQAGQTTTLDRVSVTGSRIKRAQIEGPAPVTVITAEEIQKSGLNTVYEVLNTLTQMTGDVDNELGTGSSWTPNGAFINLRAMGPGYTLVLINGRRMADYPLSYRGSSNAVSTSSIPSGAVERIEVLSGGASAIYGSDAVAGVINIITKTNYEGDELRIRGTTATRGGVDTGLFQWTGGRSGDRWSVTYGAEYMAREPLLGIQREQMDSFLRNPAFAGREEFINNPAEGVRLYRYVPNALYPVGVPVTSNYWLDASGNLVGETAAGGADAVRNTCAQWNGLFEPFNRSATVSNITGAPQGCAFWSQPATRTIQAKYSRMAAFASGVYDLENGMQLYGQFLGTALESMTADGTRFIQPTPSATIYSPHFGRAYFLRYLTIDEMGAPQQILHEETSYNVAAGLRGTMISDRFDWDLGFAHSGFEYEGKRPWLLTGPTMDYFFGGVAQGNVPGTTTPIFPNATIEHLKRWLSPVTPADYRKFADDLITTGDSSSTQASFTMSGDLFELPAGSVGTAAVVEWGRQEFETVPDPRTLTSYTGYDKALGLTSAPGAGKRDRWAVGAEFSVPIFSQLNATLAARYDDIDGMTKAAFTWQGGLEYRPTSNLLMRGNYATSYRAPDMAFVFADESGGYYRGVVDYYRCRRDGLTPTSGTGNPCSSSANPNVNEYANLQIFGTREGSQELGPEEGKSFTVGFVWDIIEGMSLSMDYYSIELKGKVAFLSVPYLLRNEADCRLGVTEGGASVDVNSAMCQQFLTIVERNPGNDNRITTFNTIVPYNQALSETAGVDTAWNYRFGTRWGNFSLRAGHTIVTKLRTQEYEGGEVIDRRHHRQYFDFRSRANWGIGWNKDGWSASLSGTYMGSLPNWAEDARIDPFVLWNGSVSKSITENIRVSLTGSNLLDANPPADDTFTTFPFMWRSYQAGVIGRQVGAEIVFKF